MHDTDPVSHGHGLDLIVSHVSGSGFAFGQNPLQLGTHFHPQQRVEVRQGFGDIEDTAVSTPGLSTMAINPKKLGTRLAEILLDRMRTLELPARQFEHSATLVARGTSGPVPDH
ncbi:substrate-binding domain-containing protein [Ruegeria arenilitoris]|uniref:substrate-binding domain-containing protein n=1 Tax=Ruegeria arenilitoris TaxID=1173585 RepID=UPI00147F8D1E